MKFRFLQIVAGIAAVLIASLVQAQDQPVYPSHIGIGTFLGETPPLKDLPVLTPQEYADMQARAEAKVMNPKLKNRSYPYQNTALPQGPDGVWQQTMGATGSPKAPLVNFAGQTSPYYPPDCNGTAGPNHYMQTVNCTYAIYSKTGTLLAGPTNMNTLFSGVTGATYNDGDPLILYDEQADRWLAVEFSISGSNDYMLIAVSTTNDPTGTWFKYSFDVDDTPDYEKFGIWRDGYYMGVNNSGSNKKDIYVFERSVMLAGGASPQMVGFDNAWRPTTIDGFMCVPPVDNDGPAAPVGSPGLFITINDDAIGGGSDQLWIYELAVNWTNTASSTFNRVQQLNVSPFDSNFGNTWSNIPQPGTTQKVDAIPMIIMNPPQYRNFGDYQTIVCCHTVDLDNTNHAGIRWYELRKPGTGGSWTIRQQGTYGPDAHNRWMGSIMLNGSGKIGLGYSISSSTVYPGIRYTGQSAAEYNAASGILDVPEDIIHTGTVSQTGANRWGDYSQMSVDPSDDETFWYTNHYAGSSSRGSRIASFKIGNAPVVTTLAATNVTLATATLNGTVNPNGLATTYQFQWGTTTSYGNTTTVTAAGAGSTAISVNAPVSGLSAGVTYHFRITATNSDGTTNGTDLTFTPGAASVTTAAITNIGLTTATGGGQVVTDGGSAVTARGVCWSTTTAPVVSGPHTTDGSGTGTFTSSLTGLTSSTTYYVRAYATNSSGTYYGNEVTFTTNCGIYTLPFSESFSGTTLPTCWSNIDNQGNGQVWQFGALTGYTPNPSLTGNYAYLNSDGYGSGNSQNADLVTPTLDMTGFTNVTLQFSHYFRSYTGSSAKLYYSVDNGSNWTLIQTWTATSANPATFNQVVAAVAGQSQVKFKWNYTGTYGYYWAVDNVQITGTATGYTLSVTPTNQNVTAPAGNTSFTVTSNTNWAAVSDAAWCTVTPSGSGNGTITATYTQNTGNARIANITVTVASLSPVVVTVTQSPSSPSLIVTPTNQNVTAPAGNTSFTVTSNSFWNVSSNASWCTVNPSGLGNGTITASYTENTSLDPRQATLTVTVAGLSPVTVTVSQAGAAPSLSVTPPTQSVPENNGSTSFTVTSNISWTASSNAAWCTVTSSGTGNGTILANYSANPDITSRTATLTVSGPGVSPVTVTVVQAAATPVLSVTPPNQNVPWQANSTTFNVYSNSTWSASSNASWCTITTGGTGSGTLTANCTENTLTDPRIATITVSAANVPTVTVTVTQSGTFSTLSVSPLNQNVTAPAGTTSFAVTSNTAWTASSNAGWCSCTSAGIGNGTLVADFTENTSTNSRIAYLTVLVANLDPFVVTVTQAGAGPTLLVTPPIQNVSAPAGSVIYSVTSNSSWTATCNQSWCTVTSSGNMNGEINAVFTENLMAIERTAQITVTVNGINPVVVTLNQEGAAPYLTLAPPQQTVTYEAGSVPFSISSNAVWTVSSDAVWCSVTPSGTGNGNINAGYTENTTGIIRTANITVSVSGLSPQAVQLIQLPSFVNIEEMPGNALKFYPNPTSGIFVISGESKNNLELDVTVMDPKGNVVLMRKLSGQPSYTLDISNAAKGNYFVKVVTSGKIIVWKLILQ